MNLSFQNLFFFLLLVFFALLLWSCNIINPAEPIPAYIEIDSVSLKTTTGQGSASQKITDAWLTVNDNDLGVYEIPKKIPVLADGSTKLIISAGILNNGSAATRAIYPFYFPDTLTLNLQSKQIYKINPVFQYRPLTKFSFIEDFESNGTLFMKASGDTNMIKTSTPENVFEGKYSGQIHTDATHLSYLGSTLQSYPIKNDGGAVYVEMNYKCNMAFQVGVNVVNSSGSNSMFEWIINPKSDWNKIYLNLTDVVALLGGGNYNILIKADKPADITEGDIFLDNIKLVNF